MKKGSSTFYSSCRPNKPISGSGNPEFFACSFCLLLSGCDLIKMKANNSDGDSDRQPAARANDSYLYKDELVGIIAPGTPAEDSAKLVEAYINTWIRKQLLIQEASRKIDINEAQVERKILDYRYSIIAYEYQTYYIKQHLDTAVSAKRLKHITREILIILSSSRILFREHLLRFPKNAPRTAKDKRVDFFYAGEGSK